MHKGGGVKASPLIIFRRITVQKWEYMWIYMAREKGKTVYIANGERLEAQTNPEALNAVGTAGWELVSTINPQTTIPAQTFPQFCLKRPISD
jgi:hypothetical protein